MPRSFKEKINKVLINAGLNPGPEVRLGNNLRKMTLLRWANSMLNDMGIQVRHMDDKVSYSEGDETYVINIIN